MIKKIIDLTQLMVNKDKPYGPRGWWQGGDQLEALRFYLDEKVEILAKTRAEENFREGDDAEVGGDIVYYTILRLGETYFLLRAWAGSCDDGMDGRNGYEYIKEKLENVLQFNSLEELRECSHSEGEIMEMPKYLLEEVVKGS